MCRMKIKNEKALVRFENYIYENLDADRKMIIPKIWNKYINSKNYYDYRENEICVNENAFYWDLLCKIRELQKEHLIQTGEEISIIEIANQLKISKEED